MNGDDEIDPEAAPNRPSDRSPRRGRPGPYTIDGKRVSAKRAALALLIEGKRVPFIAERVGVNTKTVYAWMHEEGFANELDAGLRRGVRGAERKLAANAERFADGLVRLSRTATRDDMARVKACAEGLDRVGVVKRQIIETIDHGPEEMASDDDLLKAIREEVARELRAQGWKPPENT